MRGVEQETVKTGRSAEGVGMSSKAKEWGTLVEMCLVLAGFPLAVLAPQVLWHVFGEGQDVGPGRLLVQFLAVCVVCLLYTSPSPRD